MEKDASTYIFHFRHVHASFGWRIAREPRCRSNSPCTARQGEELLRHCTFFESCRGFTVHAVEKEGSTYSVHSRIAHISRKHPRAQCIVDQSRVRRKPRRRAVLVYCLSRSLRVLKLSMKWKKRSPHTIAILEVCACRVDTRGARDF